MQKLLFLLPFIAIACTNEIPTPDEKTELPVVNDTTNTSNDVFDFVYPDGWDNGTNVDGDLNENE